MIFFDKTKKTKDVWFYEVPLIDEKKLTKMSGAVLNCQSGSWPWFWLLLF